MKDYTIYFEGAVKIVTANQVSINEFGQTIFYRLNQEEKLEIVAVMPKEALVVKRC